MKYLDSIPFPSSAQAGHIIHFIHIASHIDQSKACIVKIDDEALVSIGRIEGSLQLFRRRSLVQLINRNFAKDKQEWKENLPTKAEVHI